MQLEVQTLKREAFDKAAYAVERLKDSIVRELHPFTNQRRFFRRQKDSARVRSPWARVRWSSLSSFGSCYDAGNTSE